MANRIVLKHRQSGGAGPGAPNVAGALAGEIALNFDVGVGTPEGWVFDGTNWRRLNPSAGAPTIGVAALPGGTPGVQTGIGAAWSTFASKPTDPIVIASFGGTSYIKVGVGTADADWTPLGSSSTFATAADILLGTSTDRAIAPDQLRAHTLNAPSSAGANVPADANRLIRLNANGKIDAGFLTVSGLNIRGAVGAAAGPGTGPFVSGDMFFINVGGNSGAGWMGITPNTPLAVADAMIFDGTNWHALQANIDPNAFLPLAGTAAGRTMTDTAVVTFAVPTGAAPVTPVVRIDGGDAAKSGIDNLTISGGTF